jgi:hypothetical protein
MGLMVVWDLATNFVNVALKLAGHGDGSLVVVAPRGFALVENGQLRVESRSRWAASNSTVCKCRLRCLEMGMRLEVSAEVFSPLHRPQ